MKTMIFTIRFVILFFGMACISFNPIFGQVQKDPLIGTYKIGGSSEVFMTCTNQDKTASSFGVMRAPYTKYDSAYMDHYRSASAVGDFNGDGADEVVTIIKESIGKIKIVIPRIGKDFKISGFKEYYDETLDNSDYERLRMCSGNFDNDPEDEFVICFGKPGNFLNIMLFETDSNLNINFVNSFNNVPYKSKIFDLSSGDTDGDGYDELVLVNNISLPTYKANTTPPVFIPDYDLHVLDYNNESKAFEPSISDNVKLENGAPESGFMGELRVFDMRVSCGDIDGDGTDEIAVAWSNFYIHDYYDTPFQDAEYYWASLVFLQTFKSNQSGDGFDIIANNMASFDTHGQLNFNKEHLAMSLKCTNLDNIGNDEIIVATFGRFNIFAYSNYTNTIYKKSEINSDDNFLDIRGNETFALADLNPVMANLEFRKEIIVLKADRDFKDQLYVNNLAIKNQVDIYEQLDYEEDTITFQRTVSVPFPFSNSDNVVFNSFIAGDFDLANSEVYYIGEADIFTVQDLEQPIVILNSPPVHFDVLNSETHDLCSAYNNDGIPPFYATYKSIIDNKATTKVSVSNSYGYSSDLRKYAMVGGSGFESKVNTNFNRGSSFYSSVSHNSSIEETKNAYSEDYVLYSRLDYTYYRYPVFNSKREKVGDIGVLNPVSEQMVMSWGSGNSWVNPGYIFNHEPGNILSYKNYIDSSDFVTGPTEFTYCLFTEVPVSHTGDGSFKFTFDKIKKEGDSLSYSYGTGSDRFTKLGFEGTVSVGIDLKVFSVSRSVDYKIGMSNNISKNYSNSTMQTHNTVLENTFQVDGVIGRLKQEYDQNARYKIKPFIYRSQSGALVLDYMVDIDDNNRDWWNENYGQKPDLAFILPWRLATEKGGQNVKLSKKQQTIDIQFADPVAQPGDTVCITTRVHNYSLKEFNGRVRLKLYLGDPELDGVLLEDIYGNTEISKDIIMRFEESDQALDNEEFFTFNWQVPDTLTCSPRIYAVIDPNDEFEEIHENNNVGWNRLLVLGCDECNYPERTTGVQEPLFAGENRHRLSVYPNPASSSCVINFVLPDKEAVSIGLYSLSGVKIRNIAQEYYAVGEHELNVDTGNLEEGIYLIKVTANKYTGFSKLVISAQ